MYKILEVSDKIRVPPVKFDLGLSEAVKASLQEKLEGVVNRDFGVVLSVLSVEKIGEGKILPEDGSIHYETTFKVVVYKPEIHELVQGEIIDVTEFGAFLRFGPTDGMIHVSQLMNDFVSFDNKSNMFLGRDKKRKVKQGDTMVARIVSVSMEGEQYKIGLTARQAGLGNPDWANEPPEKERPAKAEKTEKKDKKPGKGK